MQIYLQTNTEFFHLFFTNFQSSSPKQIQTVNTFLKDFEILYKNAVGSVIKYNIFRCLFAEREREGTKFGISFETPIKKAKIQNIQQMRLDKIRGYWL